MTMTTLEQLQRQSFDDMDHWREFCTQLFQPSPDWELVRTVAPP
jgi:hypothetical protein